MGATQDPNHHRMDYNLFGMINSGEYDRAPNDIVADPDFANIPFSSNSNDHTTSVSVEDFMPAASSQCIHTGTTSGSVPDYDIVGGPRPQGGAMDRGFFELTR
jgi:hypothetical protein